MNFEMEDILMTDTDLLIQNLRRENEALRAAYHEIAEDLVAFGRELIIGSAMKYRQNCT